MHPDTRFVPGEIVWWKSLNSNRDFRGVVVRQYLDVYLGDTVVVRGGALKRPYPLRAYRINRPKSDSVTLCGPGGVI